MHRHLFHPGIAGLSNSSSEKSQGSTVESARHIRHASGKRGETAVQDRRRFTGLYTGPYFDQTGNPNNVTFDVGQTAILPCRIKQIGQKMVRHWTILLFDFTHVSTLFWSFSFFHIKVSQKLSYADETQFF